MIQVAPSIQSSRERMVTHLFPHPAMGSLVEGITRAIEASFAAERQMPNLIAAIQPSREETRRRFGILMDWAVVLRGDLKWGVHRIVDCMPEILKTVLAGGKWSPSNRQCWITGNGK